MSPAKIKELLKKQAAPDWEEIFLGDVVSDIDMDYLNQCRELPALAFEDYDRRKTWSALKSATTYEEVMDVGMHYMDKGSSGMKYVTARQKVYLQALAVMGFDKLEEWKQTLPVKFKDQGHGWDPISAAQSDAVPPQVPQELIAGMLYEGGTMMMSGASKSMKTYTMIALGLSVASGSDWMGRKCTQRTVVYLNLELQPFAMAKRIKEIAYAMGIDPPENFLAINLRGQLINIEAVEANLSKLFKNYNPGLVIVDPHYKISAASGVEENSNDAQGLLLYRLENAVCRKGAALMIAHHFSKGDKSTSKAIDRAAGGGALARWPDVIMTLTEHEEDKCCAAEFSLRNFSPIEPFVLRWQYPVWHLASGVDPSKLKKAGRPVKKSSDEMLLLLKPEGITSTELVDKAKEKGWTRTGAYESIKQLTADNKIRQVSGLIYKSLTPTT
jgi:hypothetical protein